MHYYIHLNHAIKEILVIVQIIHKQILKYIVGKITHAHKCGLKEIITFHLQ